MHVNVPDRKGFHGQAVGKESSGARSCANSLEGKVSFGLSSRDPWSRVGGQSKAWYVTAPPCNQHEKSKVMAEDHTHLQRPGAHSSLP